MSLKLSHTAIEKYKLCPQMYKLHYIDKLRPTEIPSPLFFGSAVDEAVSVLLEGGSLEDAKAMFDKCFRVFQFNGDANDLPDNPLCFYYKSDFDWRLLRDEDIEKINEKAGCELDIPAFYNAVRDGECDDKSLFNLINWLSLYRKGVLFVEAYEEQVMPNIEKVHSIQGKISLKNDEGDEIRGFLDFTADWKGEGFVVFDNKTASKKYPNNSVVTSQQLTIYCEDQGHDKAGYIVMIKALKWVKESTCIKCDNVVYSNHKTCPNLMTKKRCGGELTSRNYPKVEIQVVIDRLKEGTTEEIFSSIQTVAAEIKDSEFEQNRDSCHQFGRKCPYYDNCRNGSENDLVRLTDAQVKRR